MTNLFAFFSDTSTIFWLALFPLTYALHIADEYWSGEGYSAHVFKNYGIELSSPRFLALQMFGLALMIVGIALAAALRFPNSLLTILAGVVLANALVHSARCIMAAQTEPGLTTALVLWLPLGSVTILRTWSSMNPARFWFALLVGLLISGLVELIAMRGGRLLRPDY